jgi:hypothetical protein
VTNVFTVFKRKISLKDIKIKKWIWVMNSATAETTSNGLAVKITLSNTSPVLNVG